MRSVLRSGFVSLLAFSVVVVSGCGGSGSTGTCGSGSCPTTVPSVASTSPAGGATGVAVNTTVAATFDMPMNTSTLTTSNFTLSSSAGAVTGTVAYSSTSDTATFTPSAALAYNTQYTATITTGAESTAGGYLSANYTWTFTTQAAPAPTVTATTPTTGATGVAISSAVTATFSETMNASTLTTSTFTLQAQGGSGVAGTVSYNAADDTATLTPSAELAYDTTYTATITTGAQSSSGTGLAANDTWTFTTEAAPPPPSAPTVLSTTPANGATGIATNTTVTATFSEAMNASTLTTSTFTLSSSGGAVTGTVSYSGNTATFTPSAALAYDTAYTATITTGAQSSGGTALASAFTWQFTTEAAPAGAVTVDFGTTYQTIRGFGASTAWLGPMPTKVATALFSPSPNGLGLSILRLRIDPEGSASGGGQYGDPYETGEWDQELTNANEAVAANPNAIVFASPWTPPAAWKLSGSSTTVDGYTYNEAYASSCGSEGTGYCGGYLDPNHYADYANYLEDFVRFIDANSATNLYAISMQNEPDTNETYESCEWTPQQMDAWVASLTAGGATNPITTKLMMPESQDFLSSQAATTLSDANAQGNVSIIAGHIYQTLFGGSITAYPGLPAGDSPKELWMTEFGPLSSATPSWTQALSPYALTIHNAMVTGQYNAYVWWGAFGYSTGNCATAAGTCGLVDNSGNVTVMGDVMGQYSKFILPGYSRASATTSPASNVYVSAYTGQDNSGNQHYVIVVINTATSTNTLTFTLDNASGVTSLTPWQSTSSAGLQQQPAVTVTNGQLTYTLPASSITTLVQ